MADVFTALTHRMDYLIARQGVVAGNIANADTPQYLAKDISFAPAGQGKGGFAMAVTNAKHLGAGQGAGGFAGHLTEDSRFMQHNGNSVRLDMEMLKMNQTQLDYRTMTQLYSKQVGLQQMALGRGR
jgi:flagellar basal-body rod protein FlgB